MARDRKEVCLGIPYRFVIVDAQKPQVDFLGKVRRIGRGISEARRQITPQLAPMGLFQGRQECVLRVRRQNRLEILLRLASKRLVDGEKDTHWTTISSLNGLLVALPNSLHLGT